MPLWASGYRNLLPNRRRMYEGVSGPPGISYYVDATSGSDAYDGLTTDTAWQTISKIFTSTFAPGDFVLLKRGETWTETLLRPNQNGSLYKPITIGAYGIGARPIVDATNIHNALYIDNNRSYITIEGIEFRRDIDSGTVVNVLAGANNIIFRDCYIYGGNGLFVNAGTFDVSVLDCEVSHVKANGLMMRAARSIVRRCVIHDFGLTITDVGAVKISQNTSVDSEVTDCIIYAGETMDDNKGVFADQGGVDCNALFARNEIYNCTFGICAYLSDGVVVRNNLIYDIDLGAAGARPRGISFDTSDSCLAYHNTVYNSPEAFYINDADSNIVKNNIFSECSATPAVTVAGTDLDSHTIDNNDWHNVAQWRYGGAAFFATLALWVAGTIYDDNSIDDDPVFVTPGTDHHLQAGSLCRGAGAVDTGVTHDYDGVTRGSPPDIGAYEYVP